jgi:hypothetical protein
MILSSVLLWVDDLFLVGPRPPVTSSRLLHFDSRDLGQARWLRGMAIQRQERGHDDPNTLSND